MPEDSLSSEIYMALFDKEYPRWHVLGELPYACKFNNTNWESYGEEPKRFTWARLSSEYKWEECI